MTIMQYVTNCKANKKQFVHFKRRDIQECKITPECNFTLIDIAYLSKKRSYINLKKSCYFTTP